MARVTVMLCILAPRSHWLFRNIARKCSQMAGLGQCSAGKGGFHVSDLAGAGQQEPSAQEAPVSAALEMQHTLKIFK
jgi:hypothetical protein